MDLNNSWGDGMVHRRNEVDGDIKFGDIKPKHHAAMPGQLLFNCLPKDHAKVC